MDTRLRTSRSITHSITVEEVSWRVVRRPQFRFHLAPGMACSSPRHISRVVSPFALMHGLVGSALWFSYGVIQSDVAVWFSNTSFIIAQSIIISVVYRHGHIPRTVLLRD